MPSNETVSINIMDTMESYKIWASIEDVIPILDSAPMHRDLLPEKEIVQLTNRIPIAHLAIERGLKALIAEAGGAKEKIHGLDRLYRELKKCDQDSAAFLAKAFQDAVSFFGYNVNAKGFGQFRSLDDYLSRVGTEKNFELLRYWAIGETPKGENPIRYISPPVHRELLAALGCLFFSSRRETVSERVEQTVAYAMFDGRHIIYRADDTNKDNSVRWYGNWLLVEHPTRRSALESAVRQNFAVKEGDEFVSQTLRDAYADLSGSEDPAVLYFIHTLKYLPMGSQMRNPDAIPEVEWVNQEQTRGIVNTPAGTHLGSIEKYSDGSWGVIPLVNGALRVSDIARSLADAKNYLVNRLTMQVTAAINGESKQLRIFKDRGLFLPAVFFPETGTSADLLPYPPTYKLEFWDVGHGITPGDEISITPPSDRNQEVLYVLEGTVMTVAEHKVSVAGTNRLMNRRTKEIAANPAHEAIPGPAKGQVAHHAALAVLLAATAAEW